MSVNHGVNPNEHAVLTAFETSHVMTLRALADVCVSGNPTDRSSAARNSLRKPVRHGFVSKVSRGTYEATNKLSTFSGGLFKEAREAADMSQEAVKVAIGASSRQRVSDLERGKKSPSLTEVYALSAALGCKVTAFFSVKAKAQTVKADDTKAVA